MKNLKEMLENLLSEEKGLVDEVVETILDCNASDDDEIKNYIENVLTYGCVSGMVSGLIYYADTQAFFNRHQDEIFEIYNELLSEGMEFNQEINSNFLAWLGYEETIRRIANDLEIEY